MCYNKSLLKVLNFDMNAYFKIIFILPFFFIACGEQEEEEVIKYTAKSIRWDDIIDSRYCEENQDSLYVEGIRGLYYKSDWVTSDPCDDTNESCCHSTLCEILIYYPESLRVYYMTPGAYRGDTLYLNGKSNIVVIKEPFYGNDLSFP